MKKIILLMQIIFSFFSCSHNTNTDKGLTGKNLDYFQSYSHPLYDTIFFLSKSKPLFEYQGDLFSFFPKLGEKDSVKVREICFDRTDKKLYVWFKVENGNWISFDNVLIKKEDSY